MKANLILVLAVLSVTIAGGPMLAEQPQQQAASLSPAVCPVTGRPVLRRRSSITRGRSFILPRPAVFPRSRPARPGTPRGPITSSW